MVLTFIIIVVIAMIVENGIRKNGSLKAWVDELKKIEE
jgi:hypothetical protein